MNKTRLINEISNRTGTTKKAAEDFIKAFIEVTTETLSTGERVQLHGFGCFEVTERKARTGRNPHTGQVIRIDPTRTAKFKPGNDLKKAVRQYEKCV